MGIEVDTRKLEAEEVSSIRFADEQYDGFEATKLTRSTHCDYQFDSVNIVAKRSGMAVRVHGVQHAKDLIKALEKAIALGWLGEDNG